jgi:metal-sulfur cluster biosynthetic enzyme
MPSLFAGAQRTADASGVDRARSNAGEEMTDYEPNVLDEEIAECLREVLDPEIGLNVVDLGLVYSAHRTPWSIEVELTLTSRACPLGELVVSQIEDKLAIAFPGVEQNVQLVWAPSWSPDLITDRGYELMGRERTRTLI